MPASPRYSVTIGGYQLQNIEQLSLRFSMRELADSFSLTLVERLTVKGGEPVEISVEGRVVLVGEVVNSRLSKGAGTRDRTISGFSAAQRVVKSSVVQAKRVFVGLSLRELVTLIVEPFGLVVDVSEAARSIADEPIDQIAVDDGQTAFEFLTKAAKLQGCILVSGAASVSPEQPAKASIRITRVGVRTAPFSLVYPSPRIVNVEYEWDVRDVHSEYHVSNRGRGVLDSDGSLVGLDSVAYDERVPYSPIVIKAEKSGRKKKKKGKAQSALDRQAELEMRKRAAEGERVSLTLTEWSPNRSQALWWPNTIYHYIDTEDYFDEYMLVVSVELSINTSSGTLAKLELLPPDAFAILNDRTIKKKGKGGRDGYAENKEWLKQHAELVTQITDASDTVDFDRPNLDLIWIPEDPDA